MGSPSAVERGEGSPCAAPVQLLCRFCAGGRLCAAPVQPHSCSAPAPELCSPPWPPSIGGLQPPEPPQSISWCPAYMRALHKPSRAGVSPSGVLGHIHAPFAIQLIPDLSSFCMKSVSRSQGGYRGSLQPGVPPPPAVHPSDFQPNLLNYLQNPFFFSQPR